MLETMKSKDIFKEVKNKLLLVYEDNEASQIAFLLLASFLNLKRQDIIVDKSIEVAISVKAQLQNALQRLLNQEPIQYVLGEAHFYGLELKVSPAVLIPRPETEELVDLIIKENVSKQGLTVLDIGTGSGCIPIALSKNLKNATIHAIDISPEALNIAKENAEKQQVIIHFWELDILKKSEQNQLLNEHAKFDVIVSNPPYISIAEKAQMKKNVLDYEPTIALFVENANPLLFYERITLLAKKHLKIGGILYFEVNESFGNEVVNILKDFCFEDVQLLKDLQGKNRMVRGANSSVYKLD